MKTYTKFLINGFIKSFLNVFFVMSSLVFILNILKEIEFFSNKEVNSLYPIYLSLMSAPSIIFEMFPFIFLIATQFFFLKLFNNYDRANSIILAADFIEWKRSSSDTPFNHD